MFRLLMVFVVVTGLGVTAPIHAGGYLQQKTDQAVNKVKKTGGDFSNGVKRTGGELAKGGKAAGGELAKGGKIIGGELAKGGKTAGGELAKGTKQLGKDASRETKAGISQVVAWCKDSIRQIHNVAGPNMLNQKMEDLLSVAINFVVIACLGVAALFVPIMFLRLMLRLAFGRRRTAG